jgi:hypothetical protein
VERHEFQALLVDAVERSLAVAAQRERGQAAPSLRFRVLLNRSPDASANREFETTYPQDSGVNALRECDTVDAVVALLWRDGSVPEWINTEVVDGRQRDSDSTLINLSCCGRYASDEPWLARHPPNGSLIFNVAGDDWIR